MLFPITCLDDFFEDPDLVRQFALSLEFCPSPGGAWPGTRSSPLHEVNPNYFSYFCRKLFSLYYDPTKFPTNEYTVTTYFQLIEPFKNANGEIVPEANLGWVHTDGDDNVMAGLIYLNPNAALDSGTSIFKKKHVVGDLQLADKEDLYTTNIVTDKHVEALRRNRDNYVETLRFNNVYNRLICFDGSKLHAANNFNNSEPRLTQVFFINKIRADWFPVPSCKKVS